MVEKHHKYREYIFRRIIEWPAAFLILAGILFFTVLFYKVTIPAYADTTESPRINLVFLDEEENEILTSKSVRYGKTTSIPAIKKSYLPDKYKDKEDNIPCWVIQGTADAYYPGDDFYIEDYISETDTDDFHFVLVPDDTLLDYETSSLFFYDSDYEEIEKYTVLETKVGGKVKLPDPVPYGGKYWAYEDDDGIRKLFKEDDEFKVTDYSGEFFACGDEEIIIYYYYPVDVDYLVTEDEPGDLFATQTARVGDYITIKYSPGNVVWGHTFRGWEDYSGQFDDMLSPGKVVQIVYPEDIHFVAYYEEDENWNPDEGINEGDEEDIAMNPDGLTNGYTEKLQENAGAGVDITLNNNPKDQSFGGQISKNGGSNTKFTQDADRKTAQNGNIESSSKIEKTLTNENEDQYGRPMSSGGDLTKPLIQDDSLFAMDIYGNAFAYPYWASSEAERIEIVTNRLAQYKGNSWINFIDKHPELADAVKRFEEREFNLLKDSCTDKLKSSRMQWRGWMDYYSDIPSKDGSSSQVNNVDGQTNRLIARVKFTNSWKDYTFYQYFYDPTKSSFSNYSFNALAGLSDAQLNNIMVIYNTLIRNGYTEGAASGATAYIWDKTDSSFSTGYVGSEGKGIGAWSDDDVERYKAIAQETGESWDDINTQADFFVIWLDEHMDEINANLQMNSGMMIKEFKKVNSATNASDHICVTFYEPQEENTGSALQLFNGSYYKKAQTLRDYAMALYNAKEKTADGYKFDVSRLNLAGCSELRKRVVELACAQVGKPYIWGAEGPNAFDCSGLTRWAYLNGAGINLPHHSSSQINYGRTITQEMLRPGDLAVWDGHVAMYIGDGKMVEAVGAQQGIKITNVGRSSKHRFLGYVSILD